MRVVYILVYWIEKGWERVGCVYYIGICYIGIDRSGILESYRYSSNQNVIPCSKLKIIATCYLKRYRKFVRYLTSAIH